MGKGFSRIILLLVMLFLLQPGFTGHAAGNLLANGDFEASENGMPVGWRVEAWVMDESVSGYGVDREASYSGEQSAVIHSASENHARLVQEVRVKPNTTYRFSGYIKTAGLNESAAGAHLYIDGTALYYPQYHETNGEWGYLEFYGKTGAEQKNVLFGASLGGYGSVNSGQAWFDALSVEEVSSAPEGVEVFPLNPSSVGGDAADAEEPVKVSILGTLLFAGLFSLLYAAVHAKLFRDRGWLDRSRTRGDTLLAVSIVAALAVRIYIAAGHGGYENDVALFIFWSEQVVREGISGFYHTDIFVDYPPGYIYVLYALGHVKDWFGIVSGSSAELLLYKLPAIAADLGAAVVLYRAGRKKLGAAAGIGLAVLWLFNPAAILDSAAWGQVDAVFALALILAISGMADKRFGKASVWYAVAALIKPQAFIFMPVLLIALFIGRKWKNLAVSACCGFGAFILLALPYFWGDGGLKGLYELYKGTLASYPYATLNAFNIYALNGANWKPLTDKLLFLSYGQWGNLFILVAVAIAVLIGLRGRKREPGDRSFFIAMILISVVFLFVTKMHERYMFPILLLSLFAFLQSLDRRMLHLFYGFTITNFVNMSYVLKFSETTTDVPEDGVVLLGSIVNIALFLYMLYIGHDRFVRGRALALEPLGLDDKRRIDERTLSGFKQGLPVVDEGRSKNKLKRKDWLWMGGLTAVYAIVALVNLGSLKGPATVWEPSHARQSFYVDLGEAKTLDRVTSFGGVGTGKYKLEFALEPNNWGNPLEVDSNHVAVFAWSVHPAAFEARYIKFTVTQPGFSIHEMAVFEEGSKEPLPIAALTSDIAFEPRRGAVSNLFDEQELAEYEHSFMKGSYFDEIYHARTAYEHIEGIKAYENTHPPLGKLIIAVGIKLFGLNAFGWRIAGAFIGVLMVPIMYMTARRLFGRTAYAALAAGLLAVDFMHFTQTRISTIDVYGVFFIMLMFHFMNKYVSLSFYKTRLAATLLPLGLAGLFFGLGVASKWIVLYGGAGLAVMLGISLWERYKEYAAAKRVLKHSGETAEDYDTAALTRLTKVFPRYTIATLASCLIFYIAVPAGIYALSNIPVLTAMEGGYTFQALVDYQVHMYNYHSNLVSSHPFSSSWWEWPFIKRPVWYYSGDGLASGLKSTIAALGNPIIWWAGIFTMLATIWLSIRRKDRSVYMIWIAFLAQYVPWMLVPRETFLYHYFAMVPFLILSIAYIFKRAEEKYPRAAKIRVGFAAAAAGMFVLFYPALSGLTVPKWYVDVLLRWFPSWVF